MYSQNLYAWAVNDIPPFLKILDASTQINHVTSGSEHLWTGRRVFLSLFFQSIVNKDSLLELASQHGESLVTLIFRFPHALQDSIENTSMLNDDSPEALDAPSNLTCNGII